MKNTEVIGKFFGERASLICLNTDTNWNIREANQFTVELVGTKAIGQPLHKLFVDFHDALDFKAMLDDHQKHLLHLNTTGGLPQTFYFSFLASDDGNVVIGESDSNETEHLQKSLIEINNEMSNLTRALQKKNVQLRKLNDQKNEFLGMAAHDLRNPIGVIMGYSEFILEEAADKLPREHLNFIRIILKSSEFMLKMLNDLLDIAKIESGKLNLDKQPIDFEELVGSNLSLNRVIAEKKGIRIVQEIYEKLPEITVDPDKIEQVLNNLISNAVKFSERGTTITVSAFHDNKNMTVMVKDQGQGIPQQEIQKLFKPFSKLSVQTTDGESSTGLGLSICHKIILGHGGKIWVESKVGTGTTFYFSLPLK